MTHPSAPQNLLKILEQIHQAEAEGILADLLAPQNVEETGDEAVDGDAMKEAWARHRAARPHAEKLLARNAITAKPSADAEEARRLERSVAAQLGQFRNVLTLEQRQDRVLGMLLPKPAEAVTPEVLSE